MPGVARMCASRPYLRVVRPRSLRPAVSFASHTLETVSSAMTGLKGGRSGMTLHRTHAGQACGPGARLVMLRHDRELCLTARECAQVEHIALELRIGDARDDAGAAVSGRLARVDTPATARQIGEHRTLEVDRHRDGDRRDRLEQHRMGFGERRLHAERSGGAEGHLG